MVFSGWGNMKYVIIWLYIRDIKELEGLYEHLRSNGKSSLSPCKAGEW